MHVSIKIDDEATAEFVREQAERKHPRKNGGGGFVAKYLLELIERDKRLVERRAKKKAKKK